MKRHKSKRKVKKKYMRQQRRKKLNVSQKERTDILGIMNEEKSNKEENIFQT